MRSNRSQAGFTFFEIAVATAIFAAFTAAFATAVGSSNELAASYRANQRAAEESRKDLEAVANALRDAAVSSLEGFEEGEEGEEGEGELRATAPWYRVVVGSLEGAPVLSERRQLIWRATSAPVAGVASPGEVVCVDGADARVVCPRVPRDGFVVEQQGRTLLVTLSTFVTTSQSKTAVGKRQISVALRN